MSNEKDWLKRSLRKTNDLRIGRFNEKWKKCYGKNQTLA